MSAKNDRYRNPPAPLGYVCKNQPKITYKKKGTDGFHSKFLNFVIDLSVLDVLDSSVRDDFDDKNSSAEEGEIIEDPIEPCPKVIKLTDIDEKAEHVSDINKNILVTFKKGVDTAQSFVPSETSKDIETTNKIIVKTEPCSFKKKINSERIKRHDHDTKQSLCSKKTQVLQERRDTERNKNKKRSALETYCRKKLKKKNGEVSDNDVYTRNKYKKQDSKIDNDSCRNTCKKRSGYESDSNSYSHKTKQKRELSINSDNSRRKVTRTQCTPSASCSKDNCIDESERTLVTVKQETSTELFQIYYCYVCQLRMNNFATYQTHVTSKEHRKVSSKCRKPQPGYYRLPVDCPANIQTLVDKEVKVPCPGLDSVIEIHGVQRISYYCCLCDAPCDGNSILSHLSGFKHQLKCLQHFKKDLYDEWISRPKHQIKKLVTKELRTIQRKLYRVGRGFIKVEKECPEAASCMHKSDTATPGDADKSHKSHQASAAPLRSKYIAASSDVCPHLYMLLEKVEAPVIGMNLIWEIRTPGINGLTYYCFLCGTYIPYREIVGHILSRKHREKYLSRIQYHIKHPELETVRNCQLSESITDSVIEEMSATVEAEEGRGRPEVYYSKNAVHKW